ncbi:MAG: cupin domain-containing protein [Hyphomonadaceae bacterium]|nr:cupin domain-containing protein [Hyphomonadaceae bacterium]
MQEPWLEDPLGYLIGAERVTDFFARIYEREALIAAHNAPRRFDGLLSIDAVDRLVTSVDLREGQLDLANAATQIRRSDYVDGGGYIDRGAVAELHRAGATIILQQAHQLEPSLGRLCRALEHVFSSHVQTNLYLTPPNAQGFRTHYDNHDVLVIQVEGEKAWRLYGKPVETPYRGEAFEAGKYESGELRQEFVLKAGDCAYVPRGLMHDAMTSGAEPSLHITVGLIVRTWADLMLEAVSEVALRETELRRSLPPGYTHANFDRAAARAHLKKLAETVAREIKLDDALDLSIDTFIRSRPADNRFAVRDASRLMNASDRFKTPRFSPYRIAEDGDVVIVIAPGGELKFKREERVALERALSGTPFAAADLGAGTEDMIARLLGYGLLARA